VVVANIGCDSSAAVSAIAKDNIILVFIVEFVGWEKMAWWSSMSRLNTA